VPDFGHDTQPPAVFDSYTAYSSPHASHCERLWAVVLDAPERVNPLPMQRF